MSLAGPPPGYPGDLERIEIELLLEAIFRRHGYDFRSYAFNSIKRRLWKRIEAEGVASVSALQSLILHDNAAMRRLLHDLSINVTTMFRDPPMYRVFREEVVPILRTYPFVRLWHAGCSSGEEVYSMAILLHETGLYERCRLYATDISESVLVQARSRIFPLEKMREYTENYLAAGGDRSFSEYYTAAYEGAVFSPSLLENVVFAQHNLVTDRAFAEFHVILCRNVMIYFDRELQGRVHRLFHESLATFGVLVLGSKETLQFSDVEDCYEVLDARSKIYRKIG